jgi:hypothetical protein
MGRRGGSARVLRGASEREWRAAPLVPRHRGIDRFVRRPGPSGAAPVRDETCLCIEPMRLGVRGGPLTRVGGGRGAFFCSTHCCCTSCTNEVSAAATQAGRGETVAREVGRTAREAERSWATSTAVRRARAPSAIHRQPGVPGSSSCSSPRAPSLPRMTDAQSFHSPVSRHLVPHARVRADGHSALGTSSTWVETRRGLRVSPSSQETAAAPGEMG